EPAAPLIEAISALLFLTSYSQQFLFVFSCGRIFAGKRTCEKERKSEPEKLFIRTPAPFHQQVLQPSSSKE
ncbi:hypothetical protein PFISCL1PPCAC_13586, partial [Pristionchus fissidentatus]